MAINIGTAVVVGVLYTLRNQNPIDTESNLLILELIVPILAVASFAAAYFYGKSQYKKIENFQSLDDKLEVFKRSNIVLWAALEGSAFFGAIGFYLSGRMNLILYAVMLGVLLIYFRPLKSRAVEFLDLNPEEANQIQDTI